MENLELEILISDIKKWIDEFSSRLDRAEEELSKLEGRLVKKYLEWGMETKRGKNYREEYRRHRYGKKSNTGFLNFCTIDILSQIITCCGAHLPWGK